MRALSFRNPHEALPILLDALFKTGIERDSRNGKVLQLTGPTLVEFTHPWERVIFWPERDANPIFHAYEMLWMLAGRQDVAGVAHYVKRMATFSDDTQTLNGAYGFRWRHHFGYDQLDLIVENLKKNPNDRRQVLAMWDATSSYDFEQLSDLQNQNSKDLPCNTHAYVAINPDGRLELTVINRSNDLVWGLLGANCVHFSWLQEYLAARIGVPMGSMFTLTNNLHGYLETIEPLRDLPMNQGASPYELGIVKYQPLEQSSMLEFERDLQRLGKGDYESHFMRNVFGPMDAVHAAYKHGEYDQALELCSAILASDWSLACFEWVQRRIKRRQIAQDDGAFYDK